MLVLLREEVSHESVWCDRFIFFIGVSSEPKQAELAIERGAEILRDSHYFKVTLYLVWFAVVDYE